MALQTVSKHRAAALLVSALILAKSISIDVGGKGGRETQSGRSCLDGRAGGCVLVDVEIVADDDVTVV